MKKVSFILTLFLLFLFYFNLNSLAAAKKREAKAKIEAIENLKLNSPKEEETLNNKVVEVSIDNENDLDEKDERFGILEKSLDEKSNKEEVVEESKKETQVEKTEKVEEKEENEKEVKKVKVKEPEKLKEQKIESLIFLNKLVDLNKNLSKKTDNNILVNDFTVPDQKLFIEKMKGFIGKPLNMEVLNEIRQEVVSYYVKKGFPLTRIIIPQNQDISSGRLQILIIRARLGNIKIEGASKSTETTIRKQIHLKENEEINSEVLLEDVTWLENDPYRTIDIVYQEGEKLGTTDVILKTKEQVPVRLYTGYENSAYKVAGSSRYKAGFNLGRLWNLDHQLNGEFNSAEKYHRWFSASGNYIIPLPCRDLLKVFGTFVKSKPTADEINTPLLKKGTGKFWQVGGRYDLRFIKIGSYAQQITFGYDFKRSNDFFDYYGFNKPSQSYVDISEFLLRYEASASDKLGATFFGISLNTSPGNMTAFNKSKYYEIYRSGAKSRFIYGIFNLDRITYIQNKITWLFNTVLQFSSGKLLPQEQFSAGGHLTVRGYLENEAMGDRGILIKNEFRSPSYSIYRKKDEFQYLFFVDYAFLNNVDRNILSKDNPSLISVGPGLRYKFNDNIDVRFDYGLQLKSIRGRLFGKDIHSRSSFAAYLTF